MFDLSDVLFHVLDVGMKIIIQYIANFTNLTSDALNKES